MPDQHASSGLLAPSRPGVAPRYSDRTHVIAAARLRGRPSPLFWVAAALLVAGSAALWLARAGSSSLFTDEALSWLEARQRFHGLMTMVRKEEINPLGYPVLLHEWIRVSPSRSEFWLRLPSVICGVLVVAAIIWLALLVADRRVALLSGALALVSPFMFDYAQQMRAYIFAILGVTIAVCALLQAERSPRSQRWWVALSVLAAAVAVAMHYTAWLVLAPLWVYVLVSRGLPRSAKVAWTLVAAAASLPWLPMLLYQMRGGHNLWLTWYANLTTGHVGDVLGGPLSGRLSQPAVRGVICSAIVVAGAAICLTRRSRLVGLLVALAMVSPILLLVVTLAGQPDLLVRYISVSVPFMIVMLAIALLMFPRWLAPLAIAGVLGLSLWMVVETNKSTNQYQNFRGALTYVKSHYRPGDFVATVGNRLVGFDLAYYLPRLMPHIHVTELPPIPARWNLTMPPVVAAQRAGRTMWFLNGNLPSPTPHPHGYKLTTKRVYLDIGVLELERFRPSAYGAAAQASPSHH